jgi:REP element-mobilizing transposase RayT
MIIEKKHRLPREAYRGFVRASFTACIENRRDYFITKEDFEIHQGHLLRALSKHNCASEVHLFMPDHLHVIITGLSEFSDVYGAMKLFKQYSGFWLGRNRHEIHWQEDFHDHILRQEEGLAKLITYILNNPVRAGICERWEDYPFKGSTVFDLATWNGGIL